MKAKLFNVLPFFIPIILVAGVLLAISYVPKKETTTACTTSDYAHIPYADEYRFECTNDTMTVIDDFTDEVIAIEDRCTDGQIKAEDGSCVSEDFYGVTITNDNDSTMGVDLQPQQLTDGKWADLDWSDYFSVAPKETVTKDYIEGDREKFRYQVTVYSYDEHGVAIKEDKYYARS